MQDTAELQVDLRQMILALETAVDLVGMNDTNHGKRVGFIAAQLAHRLGFGEPDVHFAFELGLLHDCGVSTQQMHAALVNQFDWEDVQIHCEIGYRLLSGFAPLKAFAVPIRHHHTPWSQLRDAPVGPQDRRLANLVFLSDRVDVMSSGHYGKDILLAKADVVRTIEGHAGHYFDPELVQAFLEVQRAESFWIALEDRHVARFTWDMGAFQATSRLSLAELRRLSLIFAYVVDQKSPFTARHSARVASLARYLASSCGLREQQCRKIEVAGLLHDIGKLRMPDEVLEKPGPLSPAERAIMNQHSYETYEILRHIKGLEDIALWAAYHHEGINGTGYPFHPIEREINTEARVIAVADVFQALAQDRPYRAGMPLPQILEILAGMVEAGKLDRDLVALATADAQNCFAVARGEHVDHNYGEEPFYTAEDLLGLR